MVSSGHGGSRSGSGRKKSGANNARRLINAAIQRGMAEAGRRKDGQLSYVAEAEAATATAAMIVSDMIEAGLGADVLKLWAQVAVKDADQKESGLSSLQSALQQLPSAAEIGTIAQIPCIESTQNDGAMVNLWSQCSDSSSSSSVNTGTTEQTTTNHTLVDASLRSKLPPPSSTKASTQNDSSDSWDSEQTSIPNNMTYFTPQQHLPLLARTSVQDDPHPPSGDTPKTIVVGSENFEKNCIEQESIAEKLDVRSQVGLGLVHLLKGGTVGKGGVIVENNDE